MSVRNNANPWFRKGNHVKKAKKDVSKAEVDFVLPPVIPTHTINPPTGATGDTFTSVMDGVLSRVWKMDGVTLVGETGASVNIASGDLAGVLTCEGTYAEGMVVASAIVEFRAAISDPVNGVVIYTGPSGPSLTFASGNASITITGPAGTHDVFYQLASLDPEADPWTYQTVVLPGGSITGLTNGTAYRVQGTSGSDRVTVTPALPLVALAHVAAIDTWGNDPSALSNSAGVNILLIASNGNNVNIPATPSGFTSVATDSGNSGAVNVCIRENCPANLDIAAITDASTVVAWVYSGDTEIGAIAIVKGSGTALNDPALTLEGANDTGAVLAHAFIRNSTPLPARGSPAGANARATKDTGFSRHRLEQWFNVARPTFPSASRTTLAATSSGHFLVMVELENKL